MNTPVSFSTAKLLKEKGFDESCMKCYAEERLIDKKNGGDLFTGVYRLCDRSRFHKRYYLAPTIAEVVCWIYSKYDIWISVDKTFSTEFFFTVTTYNEHNSKESKDFYKTPTEAYIAAIEYTLTNLI